MVATKKRNKLPLLPASLVENRSILTYFLFLTDPIDAVVPVDLAFIQSVKEQILVAQVLLNAMSPGNRYRRSTCGNAKVKKLKKKIYRLGSYFLDSTITTHPDGRKSRRIPSNHNISSKGLPRSMKARGSGSIFNRWLNQSAYVSRKKRRKSRGSRRIHVGPYYASRGLLPPEDEAPLEPADNSTFNPDMNNIQRSDAKVNSKFPPTPSKDGWPIPKSEIRNSSHENFSLPRWMLNNGLPASITPPLKAKWLLLSRRCAIFIHPTTNLCIPKSTFNKPSKSPRPSKVLMVALSDKAPYPARWFPVKSSTSRDSLSTTHWAKKIQQHFLSKSLGIPSDRPQIPKCFKLLKLNHSPAIRPANSILRMKKLRSWINFSSSSQNAPSPLNPSIGPSTLSKSFQPSALSSAHLLDNSADDTPPLADYWSDSSSDCSDHSDTPEFLGSGPKKSSRKDITTVGGAFRPISSFWANPPRKNKDLPPPLLGSHPNESSSPQVMIPSPMVSLTPSLRSVVIANDPGSRPTLYWILYYI